MSGSKREEGLLGGITQIDNILRKSHDTLKAIEEGVRSIDPRVVADNIIVRGDRPRRSFQLEMSSIVEADGTTTITREVPVDGWVNGYVVGFPNGADQSVGVSLFDDETGEDYFPRNPEDEYFAGNDFTGQFDLTFKVEQGDELTTKLKNNDPQNPHFINSMVTVTESDDKPTIEE